MKSRESRSRLPKPVTHTLALLVLSVTFALGAPPLTPLDAPLSAASSAGCEGGGFTLTFGDGTTLGGGDEVDESVGAARVGTTIAVRGKYVEFDIVAETFGITDYAFTGAPNPLDITGGVRTPVFDAKTPDHRGLVLTGAASVEAEDEDLVIMRSGPGLTMKVQAKDCAQGGVFQMEPEREDDTATIFTHVLHTGPAGDPLTAFYFDNPNFRAREGDLVPFKDTMIRVPTRVNIANDFSRKFVARDSAQVAERVEQGCENGFLNRAGEPVIVDHCGGVSVWSVASGGRMGFVSGEDAIEVAPPPTDCTRRCQAQNRVRGRSVKLGFPFPVPADSRLAPRFPPSVP